MDEIDITKNCNNCNNSYENCPVFDCILDCSHEIYKCAEEIIMDIYNDVVREMKEKGEI